MIVVLTRCIMLVQVTSEGWVMLEVAVVEMGTIRRRYLLIITVWSARTLRA